MKIIMLGGAGAMGGALGAKLAKAGNDVTLLDASRDAVETIQAQGLTVEDKAGRIETLPIRATTDPGSVRGAELVIVLVKCYHTQSAVESIAPYVDANTAVLSLQNGWGNAQVITNLVGEERAMVGVTYHSATLVRPGYVRHAGQGMTFIGELNGAMTDRLGRVAECIRAAGLEVTATDAVLKEVWSKLSLNVCTLATSALLGVTAGRLVEHDETLSLMRALLNEVVAVAQAQNIALDEDERWTTITGLLSRAAGAKASMLQDVELRRRTEINVINGAIVAAGRQWNIPTPYNDAMFWLVRSLEKGFEVRDTAQVDS